MEEKKKIFIMAKKNCGEKFFEKMELEDLKELDSPKDRIKNITPVFIYKKDNWALITCEWLGNRRLGIRSFWDENGSPSSRGYATWYIIPEDLTFVVLNRVKELMHKKDGEALKRVYDAEVFIKKNKKI